MNGPSQSASDLHGLHEPERARVPSTDGAAPSPDAGRASMLSSATAAIGGGLVQRKIARRGLQRQVQRAEGTEAATATAGTDVIKRLDGTLAASFAAPKDGKLDIVEIGAWLKGFVEALEAAKAAGSPTASADLVKALDGCVRTHAPELEHAGGEVRTAAVQLTNDSSVTKKDPAKMILPTQAEVKKLGADAAHLNRLARDKALPVSDKERAALVAASTTVQDAVLAMLQSLSVQTARERWQDAPQTGVTGSKGNRTAIDDVFKDGGWGDKYSAGVEWCGLFVVSSMFKGGGLAQQLRAGFFHTDNVADFFNYRHELFKGQLHNAQRVPMGIWADSQWWNLKEYHETRGSMRMWMTRAQLKKALAGGAADIRPGDTCLINHSGGDEPQHIVLVESYDPATGQLATIEGNTYGIHADKSGKAERLDDDHLKNSKQGSGTAAGVHVRDLRQLAPGPGEYVVTDGQAFVRDEADLTKIKLDDKSKKVLIPKGTKVVVEEIRESGGDRFGNVKGWGFTKMTNLSTNAKPPAGGYEAKKGATVFGVGRPSMVDFEDGHTYAVNPVPDQFKTTSPDQLRELAKKKDKTGVAAGKVELK